jgi:hypothetical protein
MLNDVKSYLNKCFSMKDLAEAAYILGIKIYRDRERCLIGLSQSIYLDKVLKRFRMDKAKKGSLPMLSGKILSKAQCPAMLKDRETLSKVPYALAIGSIMYRSMAHNCIVRWPTTVNRLATHSTTTASFDGPQRRGKR